MLQNNPDHHSKMEIIRRASKLALAVMLAIQPSSALPVTAGTFPAATRGELPSLAPMLEQILPAVASIAVLSRTPAQENPLLSDPSFRRFFGLSDQEQDQDRTFQLAGSGVVIDAARGYVITSNHLVENTEEIVVKLSDGRLLQAKKVGADAPTDIALLQVPAEGLSELRLGDSDKLKVGDYVVTIGNPFGLEQTVTSGIVSALGRTGLGLEGYESFIQTDASVNPGSSGGALVNLRGELVGINSAIIGPSGSNVGLGFAIPINMVRQVIKQLALHGKVNRGALGITTQDLTPELCKALKIGPRDGAMIVRVIPKSPAGEVGLEIGDVITAVNGKKVRNAADLRNKLGVLPIGSLVRLDVIHQGARKQVSPRIVTAIIEKVEVPPKVIALAGITLGPIMQESPLYGRIEGAVVVDVKQESKAAVAGLRTDDAIFGIDQTAVKSVEDVIRIASDMEGELVLHVMREGSFLLITIDAANSRQ